MGLLALHDGRTSHGGRIIAGASNSYCEGKLIARKGDRHACPIHGENQITEGSSTVFFEGGASGESRRQLSMRRGYYRRG